MFHVEHSWNSLWREGVKTRRNVPRGTLPGVGSPMKQVFNSLTNPGRNSHFNFVCLFSLLPNADQMDRFSGDETHLLLSWFYFLSSVCCP
jgi:hypothetical protein